MAVTDALCFTASSDGGALRTHDAFFGSRASESCSCRFVCDKTIITDVEKNGMEELLENMI